MTVTSNLKTPEKVLSFLFCLVTSILVLLGFSSSMSNQGLDNAEGLGFAQFIGLSTSAWHQELDVYFTLKVLASEKTPGLGFREPLRIERDSVGFIPLKFSDYTESSTIKDRPYLSSSGVIADIGKMALNLLSFFGVPRLTGLLVLYILNIVLNGIFVFLLLIFGRSFIHRRLYLNVYRLAVVSPWVLLDSTSIMFSPAIRFAGIFALLLLWYMKGYDWKYLELFCFCTVGVVISSLNGFEFFFFELSILFLYLSLIMYRSSIRAVLIFWVSLTLVSWLASVLIWSITVFSNLKTFGDTVRLVLYTLFKHSFLRSDAPPLGAVPSGDSSLPLLDGLTELSSRMSVLLPYPFPESFQNKLHLSDDLLVVMNLATSVLAMIILMAVFARRLNSSKIVLIGIGFWSLSAMALNSYVYNHPHHMPPVGLFLILIVFVHLFRGKQKSEYSIS